MKRCLEWFRAWAVVAGLAWLAPVSALAQVALDWTVVTPRAYGDMIAVDRNDNVYVAGSDPLAFTMLVSKIAPNGSTVWQRTFDNPLTNEQSTWITVDAAGNAIVTGALVRASDGSTHGLVVLKYDPSGNLLWREVTPSAFGHALRVATDAAGNIYVLGRQWLANASGNTTLDVVTIKYAPNGTRLWMRSAGFDNFSADSPTSLAVTPAGRAIVTGGRVAAAYDAAGNLLWSKTFETTSAALDVAVAGSGAFYIVGGTWSNATGNVFLVHRFDANFNLLWRRTYGVGPWGWRVAVDSLGNAIVAGVAGAYYADWMTIKLDPDGNLLWSRRYDQHRSNDEIPFALAVGPDDAAYVTGQGGPGPESGMLSYLRTVTVKYQADGTQLWAATTFDAVRGVGVKLGTDGSVSVLGESPLTVLRYRQSGVVNQAPAALASASRTSGSEPLSVSFSSAGSADPDGTITKLDWNFGDGARSSDPHPSHTYAAGTWTATLTVTDNMGATATSAPIVITAAALAPTVTLGLASDSVVGGRSVAATVTLSNTAGALVTLSSSDGSVASVPASVQVPAGSRSATFTVRTSRVRTATPVTIRATANGSTASASLIVLRR